jgi:hypothetical protein
MVPVLVKKKLQYGFKKLKKKTEYAKPDDRPPYLIDEDFPLHPQDILEVLHEVTSHYYWNEDSNDYDDYRIWETHNYIIGEKLTVREHEDTPKGKLEIIMDSNRQGEYINFDEAKFKLTIYARFTPKANKRVKVTEEGIEDAGKKIPVGTVLNVTQTTNEGATVTNDNACKSQEFLLKQKYYNKVEWYWDQMCPCWSFPCRCAAWSILGTVVGIFIVIGAVRNTRRVLEGYN